jgi:uncharacterized protein (DUF2236 family)
MISAYTITRTDQTISETAAGTDSQTSKTIVNTIIFHQTVSSLPETPRSLMSIKP